MSNTRLSELTSITTVTDGDQFIVTDDSSSSSRKVSWAAIEASIQEISGDLTVGGGLSVSPPSSVSPGSNGELVIEATSNTQIKIKLKGSDGVVRSVSLTLS